MKPFAIILAVVVAAPATGAELFTASGQWQGEGRLATGAEAPLERGRCRVEITPDAAAGEVDVIGTCAVAAGLSDISMKLVRGAGGTVNAGVWSAATGQVVQYSGRETADAISLSSTSPLVLDEVTYETRVDVTLPDADSFGFRQLLRAEGETAWRLVAEMTYRPSGG
jgi:hypothetical protein